jgi:general secretion pathway protein E
MGIEPFLLSSTLLGVISQRLVRNICPKCRFEATLSEHEMEDYGFTSTDKVYQSKGCSHCQQTGFKGRSGIYEMIEIDDKLASMIHDGESQSQIESYSHSKSQNLRDDGIRKVNLGETTLDEVLRVTRDNL